MQKIIMTEDMIEKAAPEWAVPSYDTVEISPRRNRYCVCVPVINEGDRIRRQLTRMKMDGIFREADILILDGGSSDGSVEQNFLREARVSSLLIKTGPGKLSAQLRMGYSYALLKGYEGIITVDGNGKDGTSAIVEFIRKLGEGFDFVQGSRHLPGGRAVNTPVIRDLAVRLIHSPIISLAAGFRFTDTTNGFRAYSRRVLLDPMIAPFREVFSTYELLAYLSVRIPRLGYKTIEVPVSRKYPPAGRIPTKISFLKGNLDLLKILFMAASGKYDPPVE